MAIIPITEKIKLAKSIFNKVRSNTSDLTKDTIKRVPEEFVKASANFAKNIPGAQVAQGFGVAKGASQATSLQNESLKRQMELDSLIVKKIRESESQEEVDALRKIAEKNKPTGVISSALSEAPTTRQVLSSGAEAALLAATGYKPYLETGVLTKGRELQSAVGLAKNVKAADKAVKLVNATKATKVVDKFIKPVAREAAIGGTFFGVSEAARNKDAEINDIVQAAEMGALVGGGLTAGIIGLTSSVKAASSFFAPKVRGAIEAVERVANETPALKKEAGSQLEKTLSFIGEQPKPLKQKAAQATMRVITESKRLKAGLIDRFSPLERIQNKLENTVGRPLKEEEKIYRNARLLRSVSDADAEFRVLGLQKDLSKFDDIKDKYKAWLTQLDFVDRAKLGNSVPGGQTLQEVEDGLVRLANEIGPEDMQRVRQVRRVVHNYNYKLLKDRLEAGLIEPLEMETILTAHPNYIPHNVIMDIDERLLRGVGDTLNVASSDLMKAVGSTKNIEDPIVAMIQRTPIATRVIEKNKLLGNFVKAQEEFNIIPGMRPLQTAKNVLERRSLIVELGEMKKEADRVRQTLNMANATDRKIVAKINSLTKQIDDLSEEAIGVFTKNKDMSEEVSMISQLKTRTDSRAFEKAQITEPVRKQTEIKFLDKEISRLESTLKKADEALSSKVNELNEGALRKGTNITAEIKQVDKLQAELADALEKKMMAMLDPTMPEVRTSLKLENIQVSTKKAIEQQIVKRNAQLEQLKSKIATREGRIAEAETLKQTTTEPLIDSLTKTFAEKKQQMRTVFGDIQSLSADRKGTGEQTINLLRNGIKETWVVPDDLAVAIKNLDGAVSSTLLKILTTPQRILRQSATQLNLSFTAPNLFRDKQTAALTAQGFIEELATKNKVTPQQLNLTPAELTELYKKSGGFGSSIFQDGEEIILRKLEKSGLAKTVESANPLEIITKINEGLETSTRMQVFTKALQRGLSPKDAALVSRNATVDFAKMGSWMKPLNQAIPFLNARIQGFTNLPKALMASPEMFARTQLYTAAYPALALHQHNRRFDSYANVSQYIKNKYWVIMTGEVESTDPYNGNPITVPQFVTVPKAEGQALVAGPIQYYLEKSDELDYRSNSEMLADVLGSASPLSFQSFDQGNALLSAVSQLGPAASIGVGIGTNTDPYFGTKIIPESRVGALDEDGKKSLQFARNTPEFTKKLAGIMDVAPANLEFAINSFGGLTQDIQDGVDIAYGVVRDGKIANNSISETPFGALTRIPLTRRFLREATRFGSPAQTEQAQLKEKIEGEVKGEKLREVTDPADEIWREMNSRKTKQERLNYLASVGDQLTPEIVDKLQQLRKYRTAVEELSKTDSTEIRARYINERVLEMKQGGMSKEQRLEFLQELKDAGILTKNVFQRMAELQASIE